MPSRKKVSESHPLLYGIPDKHTTQSRDNSHLQVTCVKVQVEQPQSSHESLPSRGLCTDARNYMAIILVNKSTLVASTPLSRTLT